MRIIYIIAFFGIFYTQSLFSQDKLMYKIVWKGDSIGYLVAEKDNSGTLTTFKLKSETKFSMLISFDLYSEYHTVFRDGELLSASTRHVVNDKRKSYSTIKYLDDNYRIEVDDNVRMVNFSIPESITALYFGPPESTNIFSERHGIFCKISRTGTNKFTLLKPDDRENHYFYKDGICTRVEVNLALATIEFLKIN